MLELLEFEIVLIDERPSSELHQHRELTRPHRQMVYDELAEHIPSAAHHFVFIMTHSHQRDEYVCAHLLPKTFGYIGVLGSRSKVAQLRASLAERLPESTLQSLRAPMGLAIESHSPAEIAVSIAAEVIQYCNRAVSQSMFITRGRTCYRKEKNTENI